MTHNAIDIDRTAYERATLDDAHRVVDMVTGAEYRIVGYYDHRTALVRGPNHYDDEYRVTVDPRHGRFLPVRANGLYE